MYRPDIDGLRAVAVVPVVLYHAGWFGLSGGFVGVDVFFVISGFLITGIIDRELSLGKFSIVSFYERRARRILPALFVVVVAAFACGWVLLFPGSFSDLANSILATVFFGSNFYFMWTTDYFSTLAEFRPMLHTWSLAVEEQFYVLFPLVLIVLARWNARTRVRVVLGILVISLLMSAIVTEFIPRAAFYLAPTRAWELMLGALLALNVVPVWNGQLSRELGAGIGLAAILFSVLFYTSATPFPGVAAAIPCVGAALIIHTGRRSDRTTVVGRILSSRGLVFVGLISYSLYLWHWPVLAFLRTYYRTTHLSFSISMSAVIAAFVISIVSWRLVEQPFRNRQKIPRRQIFASAVVAAFVLLGAATSVGFAGGFPARFSQPVLDALAGARDIEKNRRECMESRSDRGYCIFGDAEVNPSVFVWGDSHAGAVVSAIAAVAETEGKSVYLASHSACAPLIGVHRTAPYNWRKCQRLNADVLEFLRLNSDEIETVVLAARWPLVTTGQRAIGEAGSGVVLTRNDGYLGSGNAEIVELGLSNTVEQLEELGLRVVLLGGVPEIGWDVPTEVAYSRHTGREYPVPPSISDVEVRHQVADLVLNKVAERTNADIVDVAPLLCSPICAVVVNGRLVYSDDDHLTLFGAKDVLAPRLSKSLTGLL